MCQWCGVSFVRQSARGPEPAFCSPAHRQAAHRARRKSEQAIAGLDYARLARQATASLDYARLARQATASLDYARLARQATASLDTARLAEQAATNLRLTGQATAGLDT